MAKVILESTDTSAYVAASDVTIYGSGSLTDKVQVLDGIKITTDGNVDRVEFARASTAYTYKSIEGGIEVLYNGVKVADVAPTKLAFTDGSATVVSTFNVSTFATEYTIGTKVVTATPAAVVPTLTTGTGETSTVGSGTGNTISAAGTSDAAGANKTFTIVAGTYEHTITGFGAGDVLDFPAGNAPGVNNASFTDGLVDLTWSSAGSTVTVHLTGISTVTSTTTVNDALLNSFDSFNATVANGGFGANTLI